MSRAEKTRAAQLNKTLKKLPPLSAEQRESLEAMTKSIVSKILKAPVQYLKANGNGDHREMVKEVFHLNTEKHS
jgi:glutamyl-tRNA reductase